MADSDDDAPVLVAAATGSAGARSGMTSFEIQQASKALEAQGLGRPGIDWKVPITIVTGFLGSGKSTLVQYILTEQHDKRIAVMVNEFGDSNDIERAMRVSDKGNEESDWIEASNGCMCCKFKDKAVEALENLIKRKGRFDHIVVETSGLADPVPLVQMFWQDVQLESPLHLNGVLTLVDAKNILNYLGRSTSNAQPHERENLSEDKKDEDGGFVEASQQIAMANSVIINKADLVDSATLEKVKTAVARLNPDAPTQVTSFSKVLNIEHLLRPATRETIPSHHETVLSPSSLHACDHSDTAHCDHPSHSAAHTANVGSVTIETDLPFKSLLHIDLLMKRVLWDTSEQSTLNSPSILRLKAFFYVKGESPVIVQGVGELYEVSKLPETNAPPLKGNRMVLIGRSLQTVDWKQMVLDESQLEITS